MLFRSRLHKGLPTSPRATEHKQAQTAHTRPRAPQPKVDLPSIRTKRIFTASSSQQVSLLSHPHKEILYYFALTRRIFTISSSQQVPLLSHPHSIRTKRIFTISSSQQVSLLSHPHKEILYYFALTRRIFTISSSQQVPLLSHKEILYYFVLTRRFFTTS